MANEGLGQNMSRMPALDRSTVMKAHQLAPEAPWNNWKVDDLGSITMQFMEDLEPYFSRWAEIWYQNFQFVYGNQSMRWSRRYGYAVDSDFLRKEPSVNQRSQTNVSRVVVEALTSMIYANLPAWDVDASDESSVKGKRFKRIINAFLDAYMIRLCMDKEFQTAATVFASFGQCGMWTDWDHRGGQIISIPQWQKVAVEVFTDFMASNMATGGLLEMPTPALDAMGQPRQEMRWQPVLDAQGQQVTQQRFAGDGRVTVLTPFEYRRAPGSYGTHKTRYIERIRLLDFDEYLDEYGRVDGKTKFWKSVQPVYNNQAVWRIAVRHFMRMQFTTPPALGDVYQRPQTAWKISAMRNKVLVAEHWDEPHDVKWARGRRLVITNGQCTHVTEPNYSTNKLDGWHPLSEAQWLAIAPSSIATGPMNDVVQKNRELNVTDSLIATAVRRNMGSSLLIKPGIGLDPQRFTGEPGKIHETPDPYGARWLHDEQPIPAVIHQLRDGYKEDVYETSGAKDALRGDRTPGVSSGYAYRQVQEREERRLAPARKAFQGLARSCGEKLWACVSQNAQKLGDDVMGFMMRRGAGEFRPEDVVALLTSKTDFGIEINIEEESMAAKSKATMQATLAELAKGPAAVRLQNPKVLDQYLKYFDAQELRAPDANHRDRAERENEVFLDMLRLGANAEGLFKPTVVFEDDDDVHMAEHQDFFVQNAEEFLQNPEMMKVWTLHQETHRMQSMEKTGALPPGTSLQVPAMAQQAAQQQAPQIQQIYQATQAHQAVAAKQGAQDAPQQDGGGKSKTPTAPTQPPVPGSGGGRQTDTAAPPAATPTAASQGGKTTAA